MQPLGECMEVKTLTVGRTSDSISLAQTNYLERVTYAVDKRDIVLQTFEKDFFECINQSNADIVLLNEEGLWGAYELSREGVDLLLTELDILLLQDSYGEGAYR